MEGASRHPPTRSYRLAKLPDEKLRLWHMATHKLGQLGTSNMRRTIIFWAKVAIGFGLFGLMFILVEPTSIVTAFRSANFTAVAIGGLLMPLNIYLQEYKWRYLVRLVKPDVKVIETLGSLLVGYAFGIITPGRIGEYSRSLFIRHTPPLKLVGLTVVDKFYNLGCTIAFGFPALLTLPWALGFVHGYQLITMIIVLAGIDALLLYLALDPRPVRSLIYALQMIFPRRGGIAQMVGGLDRFNRPQARVTLLFTLAHYLIFLIQYYFLISAFAPINLISSFRSAAAILFTKSVLPIAIGDLGLDQLASIQFFGSFGISEAAAFNASILLFAFNVLIPALLGILFIGKLQLGAKKQPDDN